MGSRREKDPVWTGPRLPSREVPDGPGLNDRWVLRGEGGSFEERGRGQDESSQGGVSLCVEILGPVAGKRVRNFSLNKQITEGKGSYTV